MRRILRRLKNIGVDKISLVTRGANLLSFDVVKSEGPFITFQKSAGGFTCETLTVPESLQFGNIRIEKGQDLHYVSGVVLRPDVPDATRTDASAGDIYSKDEVRKAAWSFLGNGSLVHDLEHASGTDDPDLRIVESHVAKNGDWLLGSLILTKKVWQDIKNKKITGYSISGRAEGSYEPVVEKSNRKIRLKSSKLKLKR